jgi:Domain of unknown function (DUF4412)
MTVTGSRSRRGHLIFVALAVLSGACAKDKGAAFLMNGSFEGEMSLEVKSPSSPSPRTIDYLIKGEKVRIKPAGSENYVVFDWSQRKGHTISEARKMALPMDLARVAARLKERSGTPQIVETRKSGTAAGYACEEVQIKQQDKSISACVIKGLGWFGGPASGGLPFLDPNVGKLFPLRLVETDASGVELMRAEAVRIEKKPVDDALVGVPSDCQVIAVASTPSTE